MLDLDSPHWERLDTFEGNPGDLPAMIRRRRTSKKPGPAQIELAGRARVAEGEPLARHGLSEPL